MRLSCPGQISQDVQGLDTLGWIANIRGWGGCSFGAEFSYIGPGGIRTLSWKSVRLVPPNGAYFNSACLLVDMQVECWRLEGPT